MRHALIVCMTLAVLRPALFAADKELKGSVREIHLSVAVEPAVKASPRKEPGKSDGKGLVAKVLGIQVESRVVQVQMERGEKLDLKLGPDVKFLGLKGGLSTKGIKDDRFVAGAEVRIVMEGQTLREIHLPYRK